MAYGYSGQIGLAQAARTGAPALSRAPQRAGVRPVPMADADTSLREQLRESEERWSLMAALASDYYWQTDVEHRLCPLQPALARRFGGAVARIEGRTRWDAYPEALSAAEWAAHRADLDARRPFRSLHIELQSADGRCVWYSISGAPRFAPDGRFLGYHGFGRDISARKDAERLMQRHNEALQQAVAERTQELQRVNADLDAFARQLAHELRTPVGQMQGLTQLLATRAGKKLSEGDRQLLTLQMQAAQQMRETLDALMLLARSATQAMAMETVDLSALCHAACAELPVLERPAPVDWQIQDGVRATGSAAALRIVVKNLLANGAKFTRRIKQPVVRVWAQAAADGSVTLCVQDNGAGFDMAQAGRLFKPFSRLHADSDHPGTGIGLSIVQRIVERHGGSVSAHGEVGAGARFDIVLPAPRA